MPGFSWFSTWPSSSRTGSHAASDSPDRTTEAFGSPVVLFDAMADGDRKEDGNASSDEESWPSTSPSRVNTPSVSTTSEEVAVTEKSAVPQKQEEISSAPDSLPPASRAGQVTHSTDARSRSIPSHFPVNGKASKLAAPHPDAPLVEVREFLTAWFIHTYDFSEGEGLRYAQKFEAHARHLRVRLNAGDLYACSSQQLEDIFGLDSELYYALQSSQYGKTYNIWHHIPFLGAAVTFFVAVHNFNAACGGQIGAFVLPTIGASTLHTLTAHAFRYCTSPRVIDTSAGFPERLKGRPWCIGEMDYALYLGVNLALVWMIPLPVLLWQVVVFLAFFLSQI
ncbi:MAG: hypothetical protein Q9182_004709 [Xanthomendoza sp. 2 TL-2023]